MYKLDVNLQLALAANSDEWWASPKRRIGACTNHKSEIRLAVRASLPCPDESTHPPTGPPLGSRDRALDGEQGRAPARHVCSTSRPRLGPGPGPAAADHVAGRKEHSGTQCRAHPPHHMPHCQCRTLRTDALQPSSSITPQYPTPLKYWSIYISPFHLNENPNFSTKKKREALFDACLFGCTFSAMEQCFFSHNKLAISTPSIQENMQL
jgi:hypothetical protein